MISEDHTKDAVRTQQMLDRFLTRFNELSAKESQKGLTPEEANEIQNMAVSKIFVDIMTETEDPSLAGAIEADMIEYYKRSKK